MNKTTGQRAIERIKVKLLSSHPFFGHLACSLDWRESEEVPTAATDGKSVLFNSAFVDPLDDAKRLGLAAHEIMHVALKHHLRRGERNPMLWNIACDYVINGQLTGLDKLSLPDGGLVDSQYNGMTEEEIYSKLLQQQQQQQSGSSGDVADPGQCGAVVDAGSLGNPANGKGQQKTGQGADSTGSASTVMTQAEIVKESQRVDKLLESAQAACRARGKGSLFGETICAANREPVVDWRAELRRYLSPMFPTLTTWNRPDKRAFASGIYAPGVIKDGFANIAVAVDTSGSVGSETVAEFLREIKCIVDELHCERVDVLPFAFDVYEHQTYRPGETFQEPEDFDRGGTDFDSVFRYVEEESISPRCLVMLTDMFAPFTDDPPDYPVLWIATSDIVAPFGETIRYND